MSSGNSYPRCELELRSSRTLLVYFFLLLPAAVLAPCWISALPFHLALSASVPALLFTPSLWRWARGELTNIIWQSEGRWTLVERCGDVHEECNLLPGIHNGASVTLLHWRCIECGSRFGAALLADNCDEQAKRRMVVRLNVTPDSELFVAQSLRESLSLWVPKFAGTRTVSRGGCRSSRSG